MDTTIISWILSSSLLVIMPGHKGLKNSLFDLSLHVLSLLPSYKVQCFSITRLANLTVNQLLVGEYATHGCLSSSIELLKVKLLKLAYHNVFVNQGRSQCTKIMGITWLYASLSCSFVLNNVLYSLQVVIMACVFCHSLFTYGHVLSLMFQFMWAFINNCTYCCWAITEMAC